MSRKRSHAAVAERLQATNLTLHAQSLAATVITEVSDRAADLVRIAAYIYAADQEVSRGGEHDVHRRDWRRHLAPCMPVADPEFWMAQPVRSRLIAVLTFLTEDEWDVHFSRSHPPYRQLALQLDATTALCD